MVSAGHLPVLHLKAGGVFSRAATSYPLGMFRSAEFQPMHITLAAGESLLLYTDGATDTRNELGESFGTEHFHGFLEALPMTTHPKAWTEELRRCLEEFRGAQRPVDDVTCILARVN